MPEPAPAIIVGVDTHSDTHTGGRYRPCRPATALILLCQSGEVFEDDGVESSGEVARDAADNFSV